MMQKSFVSYMTIFRFFRHSGHVTVGSDTHTDRIDVLNLVTHVLVLYLILKDSEHLKSDFTYLKGYSD